MLTKTLTYILISLAVILVIAFGSFAVGYKLGGRFGQPVSNSFASLGSFNSITGTINKVAGNYLEIEGTPLIDRPCVCPSAIVKKVIIDEQTKIYRQRERTIEEKREMQKNPDMPLSIFIQEEVSRDSLKIGDRLTVNAKKAIEEKADIVASQMVILMPL